MDRAFTKLHEVSGPRYVDRMFLVGAIAILGLTVALVGAVALYLHASAREFRNELILGEIGELAMVPVWYRIAQRRLAPCRRWLAGDRTPESAAATWLNVLHGIPNVTIMVNVACLAGAIPAEVYGVTTVADTWLEAVLLVVAVQVLTASLGTLLYLAFESATQQFMPEIARMHPSIPREAEGVAMSTKLLLLPPIMSFVTVIEGGALVVVPDDPGAQIGTALASATVLTLTISLGTTLLMRRSLLVPLKALRRAAGRVGQGDLDVWVPPMAGDELGSLTHSFNDMVEDLRRTSDELRESRARIVATTDAERRRVERDLHDGAQQRLVLIRLKLGLLRRGLESEDDRATVARLEADMSRALQEVRELAHGIYPTVLESDGLPGALATAVARVVPSAKLECVDVGRHERELEAAVYFCCLQALQNVASHAGPHATTRVNLRQAGGRLSFEISDDGPGFDIGRSQHGRLGLQNMADRVGALGGSLEIRSEPGAGTTVVGSVPAA